MANGAIYVSDSGNSKIIGSQKADATYVSIEGSCPGSCALRDSGCYAKYGRLGILQRRLDSEAIDTDANAAEVTAIDQSYKSGAVPEGRALRLHVSGDCRTIKAARALASAIDRWQARGGGAAWNYTHAWRRVKRSHYGPISVLASCENSKQAREARRQGYAPALVVDHHPADGRSWIKHGIRWIPCPAQTREVGCTDCRLCFDADALFKRRAGIAFAAHGARREVVKRRLTIVKG